MQQPTNDGLEAARIEGEEMAQARKKIVIFGRRMPLPQSRFWRIVLGIALIIGGIFSFLPILGVWMLPLGMLVLSVDLPFVRRWRRRNEVRWGRWRARRRARKEGIDLDAERLKRREAVAEPGRLDG